MQINDPVMYHQSQSDKDSNAFRCGSVDHPVPATVTAVHDDGTVDVDVIEAGGRTIARLNVPAQRTPDPGEAYVMAAAVHAPDGKVVQWLQERGIAPDSLPEGTVRILAEKMAGGAVSESELEAAFEAVNKVAAENLEASGIVATASTVTGGAGRKWLLSGGEWTRTHEVSANGIFDSLGDEDSKVHCIDLPAGDDVIRLWVASSAPEVGWQDISDEEYMAAQQEASANPQTTEESAEA